MNSNLSQIRKRIETRGKTHEKKCIYILDNLKSFK